MPFWISFSFFRLNNPCGLIATKANAVHKCAMSAKTLACSKNDDLLHLLDAESQNDRKNLPWLLEHRENAKIKWNNCGEITKRYYWPRNCTYYHLWKIYLKKVLVKSPITVGTHGTFHPRNCRANASFYSHDFFFQCSFCFAALITIQLSYSRHI